MKKTTDKERAMRELMETAVELSSYGLVSRPDMARMRALCEEPPVYTPKRVIAIRTKVAKTSQAVFATFLNVSTSTVQKWESPKAKKHPSGAAAKLLQIVETKGLQALML